MFETTVSTSPFEFGHFRHSIRWAHYLEHKLIVLALVTVVLLVIHALFKVQLGESLATVEHASLLTDVGYALTKKNG